MVSTTRTDKVHGDFGQWEGPLGLLLLSPGGCRASRVHPEAPVGCSTFAERHQATPRFRADERKIRPRKYEKSPQFS